MNEMMLQPLNLGNLTLPNRVVMTTVKLGYGAQKGEVNNHHIAFYVRRARGGVGLITTEPMYVLRNGRELPTQLGIHIVVIAVGVRPNRTLVDALEQNELEMYVIGDADQPRKALEAIWEGFEVGLKM